MKTRIYAAPAVKGLTYKILVIVCVLGADGATGLWRSGPQTTRLDASHGHPRIYHLSAIKTPLTAWKQTLNLSRHRWILVLVIIRQY